MMSKMLKKWLTRKVGFIISLVVIGVGVFYWFEVRPTIIRHDCSWVKKHADAVPARAALSEAELRQKGMLNECDLSKFIVPTKQPQSASFKLLNETRKKTLCGNEQIIREYSVAKPAVPARDWYERAAMEEYQFCLHDKGL